MNSKLRILPIGGCGEVGKNMTIIEYDDQILIVDCGIMFPMNDMLGVDSIIPDFNYLRGKEDRIIGVLVTHGHEDHIGALSYFLEEMPVPVYGTPLTLGLIRNKLREAQLKNIPLEEIQAGDAFNVGDHFMVEPFHVTHSIPDCVGFGITTPCGLIVHTGDYKFDYTPIDGWPPDFAKLAEFSARGVLALLADSTNSTVPGWTTSEQEVKIALEKIFEEATGRIMISSFASLISRIWLVAEAAQRHGRKLALAGRSMKNNVKLAQKLGYLDLPEGLLIDIAEANSLPASQVAIMATGSQGEPTSALGRLARGRHPNLRVLKGDTIVISAHAIPGNEEVVYRIINLLLQKGAKVLYEETPNIHVSGHASQDEMKLMINLVKPKFFIPVHGEIRHLQHHAVLAEKCGIPSARIAVIENGTPVDFSQDQKMEVQPRLKGGYVFVQGGTAGMIGFADIRVRERLAKAGFFLASLRITRDGELLTKPKYSSAGFINLDDNKEMIDGLEKVIRSAANIYKADWVQLESHMSGAIARYLYDETRLRPDVYVVLHEGR